MLHDRFVHQIMPKTASDAAWPQESCQVKPIHFVIGVAQHEFAFGDIKEEAAVHPIREELEAVLQALDQKMQLMQPVVDAACFSRQRPMEGLNTGHS